MPSPLGHSLAGLAVAWFARPASAAAGPTFAPRGPYRASPRQWRRITRTLWFWCALVAALPDIDLVIPQAHRSATHSFTASILIFIVMVVVTGKVTRRPAWGLATALAVAHASHVLLDWLGSDRFPPFGLQAFWPLSDRFYISGVDLFPPVERRLLRPEAFSVNAHAAIAELLIAGPVTALAWVTARVRYRRQRDGHTDAIAVAHRAAQAPQNPQASGRTESLHTQFTQPDSTATIPRDTRHGRSPLE